MNLAEMLSGPLAFCSLFYLVLQEPAKAGLPGLVGMGGRLGARLYPRDLDHYQLKQMLCPCGLQGQCFSHGYYDLCLCQMLSIGLHETRNSD